MKTDVEQRLESGASVSLTFGQIEAVLADIHVIAADKRVAFAGRLKALQRNGLPVGDRPGRGKAAEFSYLQFLQFAIGIELMQAGISPAPATQIVRANWPILRHSIGYAFWQMLKSDEADGVLAAVPLDLLWVVRLRDFADLSRDKFKAGTLEIGSIEPVQSQTLANALSSVRFHRGAGQTHSLLVLEAGRLIWTTWCEVTRLKFADTKAIVDEILEPSTLPTGLKGSTPPWSDEAERFFRNEVDDRIIRTAAEDFINHAPPTLQDMFVRFCEVGLNTKALLPADLLKLEALAAWSLTNFSDASEYSLTRVGDLALSILGDGKENHVDPKA